MINLHFLLLLLVLAGIVAGWEEVGFLTTPSHSKEEGPRTVPSLFEKMGLQNGCACTEEAKAKWCEEKNGEKEAMTSAQQATTTPSFVLDPGLVRNQKGDVFDWAP